MDVYADEGITGTSAEKRDDFQRLLKDCRRGRIDKVLTKSTARFARNTSESLMAVRELRDLGIGVCFEEQGIDTAQMSGELLTAIFSMIAQKESEAISENIRWTYQKKMKKGSFITCKAPFGYRLVKGGLEIVEAEAEIIRLIFQRYLNGRSMRTSQKRSRGTGSPQEIRPHTGRQRRSNMSSTMRNMRVTRWHKRPIPPEHCPTGRSEIKVSMTNISYRAAIPLLLTGNCLTGHRHC